MGLGNRLSVFAQTVEVEFYRFANVPLDLFDGPASTIMPAPKYPP
jgi:hypothetical protein